MTETAWNRLSAEALRALAARDAVVLLPVASTEQHGPHLPTGVDDILCGAVCRRAAGLLAPDLPVVVAPTLWCGLAEHHVALGGTFSLSLPTYHALLRDLCGSILRAGFRRIVLVNGHGGNIAALAALTVELTRELDAPVATATYFMDGTEAARALLEDQDGLMHACEAETSMMMALEPNLVDGARLPEAHGPAFDVAAWLLPTLRRPRSFSEFTPRGVAGDARRADARKGEALLAVYAGALAACLRAGEPWAPAGAA
ncbi:Creatinine amidohydrolase [Methylobacterium crusticola]|uniref:Creatinine amidohydrolase n=1 Tax=Methylobacterium crusticola TaxID=1697972 RepID=A0ABQ4QUL8_9HYPH|nr:creatininase family protein [Methylobacterium crusticola]GJD48605.1 Creatinine amidohydrolase [Methylobacterium crusticola]